MEELDKSSIKKAIGETLELVKQPGLAIGDKANEIFIKAISDSIAAYEKNANKDYFQKKYPGKSKEFIEEKLIKVSASNSGLLGGITGAAISAQEIAGLAGLPITAPVAVTTGLASLIAEMAILIKLQSKMILELADLHDLKIDREDPEDIIFIVKCLLLAKAQDMVRVPLVKVGAKMSIEFSKKVATKELSKFLKSLGVKIGTKMLQRSIARYAVPGISILIGTLWNRQSTKAVAKYTLNYIKKRKEELSNNNSIMSVEPN